MTARLFSRAAAALLAAALAVPPLPAVCETDTAVTILVYVCGSDLETEDGSATEDLEEMREGLEGSDGRVRVLVETGGTEDWQKSGIKDGSVQRHELTADGLVTLDTVGRANMGEASTLADFLSWGYSEAPADRVMLVLWDHGGGPVFGFGADELFDWDSLTLSELDQALSAGIPSGEKLAMLGFDACLMGSAEVASVVSGYADYMLASEEMEPGYGWAHTGWIAALCADPAMSTEEVGRQAVADFVDEYDGGFSGETATLSLLDLKYTDELTAAMDALGTELTASMRGSMSTVSRARASVTSFGEFVGEDASDLVDILEFCDAVDTLTDTSALRQAVEDMVVVSGATQELTGRAGGLSMLVPYSTIGTDSEYIEECYSELTSLGGYGGFVRGMIEGMSSADYVFSSGAQPENLITNTQDGVVSGLWNGLGASGTGSQTSDAPEGLWAGLGGAGNTSSSSNGLWSGLNGNQASAGLWSGLDLGSGNAQITGLWEGLTGGSEDVYTEEEDNPNVTALTPAENADEHIQSYFADSELPLQAVYALRLSREDLDHLSGAKAVLLGSDGDMIFEYGEMGETTIDWQTGSVYAMFDGSWVTVGGSMATVYPLDSNGTRAIIPARVGGIDMYLMAVFEDGKGAITGATQGYYADSHMAARGLIPLTEGLTITLLHPSADGDGETRWIDGDTLTVPAEGLSAEKTALPSGEYLYAIRLTDIYNQSKLTDTVTLNF